MPNFVPPEAGVIAWVSVTGLKTITSGFAQIVGIGCASSSTGGNLQIFAGVTQSASISPIMIVGSPTGTAQASFQRFPLVVSGSGFTINYTGTLDPNLMLFWLPVGGP